MDPKDQKAVPGAVETPGQGVNGSAQAAPPEQKDFEAIVAEKEALISKLTEQRDNYKRGMLKAKGKLDDDDEAEEGATDIREIARQETLAILIENDILREQKEKDDLIARALKENKELKLALQNSPGGATVIGGSQTGEAPKDNILSEQQIMQLKTERGWSDAQVENLKKLMSQR